MYVGSHGVPSLPLNVSSENIQTMESAIREGSVEAVRLVLANKPPGEQLQILSTKYGSRADSKFPGDSCRVWPYAGRLYGGTSPILHAALTGNVEIFWEIAEAIRINQLAVDADRVSGVLITRLSWGGESNKSLGLHA